MSLYNEQELEAPAWMDKQFFFNVLSSYEKTPQVEIVEFQLSPASMKGDHYASVMFRCKVTYRVGKSADMKTKSLILKTMPEAEGMKKDMLSEMTLFETEISMYTQALPKIEGILKESGEPTRLSAEIIYYSLDPHKFIIFEDICESGYNVLRSRLLNEEEIKCIYRKIAKLHAVSFMLGQSEDHACVTQYQNGIFCETASTIEEITINGFNFFKNCLARLKEFAPQYEKFTQVKEDILPRTKDLYRAYALNKGQGDIFVLNHGDFHLKNLMFKFNANGEVEDVIPVDYQMSCFAPANVDMLYSQYMLLSCELRPRRHEFLQYYFTEFLRVLKKINYEGELPKYSQLQISNLKYRHFTLLLVSAFLPMVIAVLSRPLEELKDIDVDKVIETPEQIENFYDYPVFIEELHTLLPVLLNEGYFD